MMSESTDQVLPGYVGRFTLVHVLVYMIVATLVLAGQDALPEATRVALETFAIYRPLGLVEFVGQAVRALILALVLYPAYDKIVRSNRGGLILFGARWGIVWVGSVAPMPGSIEGVIYTEIPLAAHVLGLAVSALEVLLFSGLFLRWERASTLRSEQELKESVYHG